MARLIVQARLTLRSRHGHLASHGALFACAAFLSILMAGYTSGVLGLVLSTGDVPLDPYNCFQGRCLISGVMSLTSWNVLQSLSSSLQRSFRKPSAVDMAYGRLSCLDHAPLSGSGMFMHLRTHLLNEACAHMLSAHSTSMW